MGGIQSLFPYPNHLRGTKKRRGLQRSLQGVRLPSRAYWAESDFRVRPTEVINCLREVSGKFCLTAGEFPRRPFDDSFNPLPDSNITVVLLGLCRRQGL